MKIDFTQPLKDIEGNEIKEGDKVITLGILANRALDGTLPGETSVSTEDKLARWDLMLRIRDGGEIEKSELKLIKDRIGQAYAPSVVGYAHALLNGVVADGT